MTGRLMIRQLLEHSLVLLQNVCGTMCQLCFNSKQNKLIRVAVALSSAGRQHYIGGSDGRGPVNKRGYQIGGGGGRGKGSNNNYCPGHVQAL